MLRVCVSECNITNKRVTSHNTIIIHTFKKIELVPFRIHVYLRFAHTYLSILFLGKSNYKAVNGVSHTEMLNSIIFLCILKCSRIGQISPTNVLVVVASTVITEQDQVFRAKIFIPFIN